MANFALEGIAIIAGAAGGIGKETGLSFAEAGVNGIIFADINKDLVMKTVQECNDLIKRPGFKAIAVQLDVTDAKSILNMIDVVIKEFGRVDYLVNSAGVDQAEYVPITLTSEEDYERVMAVNTKGTFLVTKAVAALMQQQEPRTMTSRRWGTRSVGRGAIVNIASAAGLAGIPAKVSYVTSKHALQGLTRTAALDLKGHDIRVNMICPTWVRTPMFEEESRRVPIISDLIQKVTATGRPLDTDEVAAAAHYLCSPAAAYITGTWIILDNGLTAGPTFI